MKTADELAVYVVQIFENIQNLTPKEALQITTTMSVHVSAAIIQDRTIKDIYENGLFEEKEG